MTQSELEELFTYDPETGILRWRHCRNAKTPAGRAVGCLNKAGYVVTLISKKNYSVHRLIWTLVYGEEPEEIDHINGLKGDNRLCNLRSCTRSQNAKNKGLFVSNSTGYKGVHWCNRTKGFVASCKVNRVKKWLGRFPTAAEAHAAYVSYAQAQHGEFFSANRPLTARLSP